MNIGSLFETLRGLKVAVVGDVMLDTYWWGTADRISPEAPVPVVRLERTEYRIGGAANVALNAKVFTDSVSLLSVTGADADGHLLRKALSDNGIQTQGLVESKARITTNKTRVISRNQQMIRLDHETTSDLSLEDEKEFLNNTLVFLEEQRPDVLIFEDYNKGVLTPTIIRELLSFCRLNKIVTSVDPKQKNFFSYKGVDLFKPNLKEVREGLGSHIEDITRQALSEMHRQLHQRLEHRLSLITLSEKGIFCEEEGVGSWLMPSLRRKIADVSGAGDTVIAVASLVYAATKDPVLATQLSNIAGGLVCEEVGTVPVSRERLMNECELVLKDLS